jgi:hypothetical protein
VTAAFASVHGDEVENGSSVILPAGKAFATNFKPVLLRHFKTGSYGVQIAQLGDPTTFGNEPRGVVHVRAVGADAFCMSDDLSNLNDFDNTTLLFIGVDCFDAKGAPADRPFTASYTRGGTQTGALVTARVDRNPKPDAAGAIKPSFQESSVGGQVTVKRTAPGDYAFTLPVLTGTGPGTLAVSPMAGLNGTASAATCAITSTALINNATAKQVNVACRHVGDGPDPSVGEAADPGIAITYAKRTNLLGVTALSSAYFGMPKTTADRTVLAADKARNQIFGQTDGAVTVLRKKAGSYQIDLQNQQGGFKPETTIVTAQGAANVACRANPSITIPGNESDEQTLLVKCKDFAGQLTDTAFQLQYSAHQ